MAAIALLLSCTVSTPPDASARSHNNNSMQQTIILNNLNAEQQSLLNQINTYVTSGQLSPQQGAAFSAELSQIASQATLAATNPMMTQQIINQFSDLSSQIQTSLQTAGFYTQQYTVPLAGGSGLYESWRNNWAAEQGRIQADMANRRAERMNYDAQVQARKLQELSEKAAAEQNRFAQMTAQQQTEYAQRIHRDQLAAAQNPAFQGKLQRDAMAQSRALNDLASRQASAQAAIARQQQNIQNEGARDHR